MIENGMALGAQELTKLEEDFRTGRNPLAYIPLSQALRRARRLSEALEICQRGIGYDPGSIAGRTQLIRILLDMGRYADALREIETAEKGGRALNATGLMAEKARCCLRLRREDEARAILSELDRTNPLDAQVQLLKAELRTLSKQGDRGRVVAGTPLRTSFVSRMDEVVRALRDQVTPLGKVHTIAILDLDSEKACVEGGGEIAEVGSAFHEEVAVVCDEMDQGMLHYALLELQKALVMVIRRQRKLVVLVIDPGANFGKLQHRVQIVLSQYLPPVLSSENLRKDEY